MHLNLHSREFRDEDRSDSRTASLHHHHHLLLLLSTSVSSSTSVYIFLPSTHSPRKHECYPAGALQQKVLLAQPERFLERLFLDPASLPSLTLRPVLPFAKSVITMRPVRNTYRSLSQTEPWRSRARLARRKGE